MRKLAVTQTPAGCSFIFLLSYGFTGRGPTATGRETTCQRLGVHHPVFIGILEHCIAEGNRSVKS